ncbi:MAG: sugar phosphate isomerase/epimerase [Phycisphaerae bacterium]|nr:sugar phosphate isomerase/epimerase [Phycisphaerae bacterium]
MSRRDLIKGTLAGAAMTLTGVSLQQATAQTAPYPIRLGGPVFGSVNDPDQWIAALKQLGYSAAYCPVGPEAGDDTVKAYARAAARANIVIAEVGAWSNPLSSDDQERQAALTKCREGLALADRIGARCCVNISGSRGPQWAGPSEKNLTDETFDMIVATTRAILDEVKPTRTFFTLEAMPWAYPDSPESYVRLLKAIDRKQFAVHLDPTNLVCSPQRYYNNGQLIQECFRLLGPHIKSCHAKDVLLSTEALTHLSEVRIGLGRLDYAVFLKALSRLGDVPLMLEHLPNAQEYQLAAQQVRSVAHSIGLTFA